MRLASLSLLCLLGGCRGLLGFENATVSSDATDGVSVGFSSASSTVDEASTAVQIPVVLSAVHADSVTVSYSVAGGTATTGADFTITGSTLTFAPGQTEQTIELSIVADGIEEDSETIDLRLSTPSGATLATNNHTITISPNILPRVQFTTAASVAGEAAATMIVMTLDRAPTIAVTVELSVTGTATGGVDHTLGDQVIAFPAGTTTQMLPLAIIDDALDEDDELLDLQLKNASAGLLVGATATHVHTIQDNDAAPAVSFMTATSTVTEANAPHAIVVALSAPSGKPVTVPFSLMAGTAVDPSDYTLGTSSPLVFPPGTTTQTITVNVVDDLLDEDGETAIVQLGAPTNATTAAPASHTATLTDNDATPLVSFDPAETDGSSIEGDGGGTVTRVYKLVLNAASGRTATVPITFSGGAANPADYTVSTALPLVFAPGETQKTITLLLVRDSTNEPDDIVVMQIPTAGLVNVSRGSPNSRVHQIIDDD